MTMTQNNFGLKMNQIVTVLFLLNIVWTHNNEIMNYVRQIVFIRLTRGAWIKTVRRIKAEKCQYFNTILHFVWSYYVVPCRNIVNYSWLYRQHCLSELCINVEVDLPVFEFESLKALIIICRRSSVTHVVFPKVNVTLAFYKLNEL